MKGSETLNLRFNLQDIRKTLAKTLCVRRFSRFQKEGEWDRSFERKEMRNIDYKRARKWNIYIQNSKKSRFAEVLVQRENIILKQFSRLQKDWVMRTLDQYSKKMERGTRQKCMAQNFRKKIAQMSNMEKWKRGRDVQVNLHDPRDGGRNVSIEQRKK